jgi:hypothetical protein
MIALRTDLLDVGIVTIGLVFTSSRDTEESLVHLARLSDSMMRHVRIVAADHLGADTKIAEPCQIGLLG